MYTFDTRYATFSIVQLCASNRYASIQRGGKTHLDPSGTVYRNLRRTDDANKTHSLHDYATTAWRV